MKRRRGRGEENRGEQRSKGDGGGEEEREGRVRGDEERKRGGEVKTGRGG